QFQISPDGKDIRRDALNYKLNGADEYALEEAVRIKEKQGGRVVAVTLGPKRTEQMLREALAKGADEAVRIAYDDPSAFDVGKNARLLAAAIRTLPHDRVLTGVQSDDYVNSATGGLLAGVLGLPHASVVTRVVVRERQLEVTCELEGGLQRVYALPLPALLTIQFGASAARIAVLGSGVRELADRLAGYTLDVLLAEHPALTEYTGDGYVRAVRGMVESNSPRAILVAHTSQGYDFASALAGAMDLPLVTN